MAYLDVITLADAKAYLKIDDTQTEDDAIIERAIKTSLSYLEDQTNVLVFAREKEYRITNYCIDVYDFPLNSLVSPADATSVIKTLKSTYTTTEENVLLVLNVGYSDVNDVPIDLINVAYEMIDVLYSGREERTSTLNLSAIGIDIIYKLKRFV